MAAATFNENNSYFKGNNNTHAALLKLSFYGSIVKHVRQKDGAQPVILATDSVLSMHSELVEEKGKVYRRSVIDDCIIIWEANPNDASTSS